MTRWTVLWRKEMLELWRSYKWLWVPLVFIVLGAMQPLTAYYLPQIIDSVGGLPEGAVIEIPPPRPGEAIASSLNQIATMGVLVLVLAGMGAVASERSSGTTAMVLVKPVGRTGYLLAKWVAYNLLMLVALILGQAAAWFYTDLLIGPMSAQTILGATAVFAVWLAFLITLLIALGTILRSAAAVAVVTLAVAVVLAVATSTFGASLSWSPAALPTIASNILTGTGSADGAALPIAVAVAAITALLAAAGAALGRAPMVPG